MTNCCAGSRSRLAAVIRPGDTVARLGGDEFALLLEDTSPEGAMSIAQRVIESLALPLRISGADLSVSASVGVVCHRGPGEPLELLRYADIAMYEAKRAGKSRVQLFEERMHQSAKHQMALRIDLAAALSEGQLSVCYQPIVSLADRQIRGVEALVRWTHPTRRDISPSEFIPIAEQSGLIGAIGEWVLQTACAEAAGWGSSGVAPYLSGTSRQPKSAISDLFNR